MTNPNYEVIARLKKLFCNLLGALEVCAEILPRQSTYIAKNALEGSEEEARHLIDLLGDPIKFQIKSPLLEFAELTRNFLANDNSEHAIYLRQQAEKAIAWSQGEVNGGT